MQTPNSTNSLCGYKIVTGQPSDRLGEDFSENYKDFTERYAIFLPFCLFLVYLPGFFLFFINILTNSIPSQINPIFAVFSLCPTPLMPQ